MSSNVTSTCLPVEVTASGIDAENADGPSTAIASESFDIEHVHVDNDPRKWSNLRKTSVLCMIFSANMFAGLLLNILNPAIRQVETDLRATSGEISLTLSIFILVQGILPLLWTTFSEIKGRKLVYVLSLTFALVGCIVAAEAKSIGMLIGMRAIQATGTSSVMAIGAATLADIYEPFERGTKLGIIYAAPLLGPSLGPVLGGLLTQAFSWRALFRLLAAAIGVDLVLFVFFFHDTFRKERSLTYQRALASRRCAASNDSSVITGLDPAHESDNKPKEEAIVTAGEASVTPPGLEVTLSFKDLNPFPPLLLVLRRRNNIATLFPSGLFLAFAINISYTSSRLLGNHYKYDPLKIGLVLLSYGTGSIFGSVLGGRWSDHTLRRLTNANGGKYSPEMRFESSKLAMIFLPLSVIAYAWLAQERVHVAALCTALFLMGFFSIWIYSTTLAYIVDSNPGLSSAAVAANSVFRGVAPFVFIEVVVPLQDSMGDGGLYTLWAGILFLCELLLLLVRSRGGAWREAADERERPQG